MKIFKLLPASAISMTQNEYCGSNVAVMWLLVPGCDISTVLLQTVIHSMT